MTSNMAAYTSGPSAAVDDPASRHHGNKKNDNKDSKWLTLEVCPDHFNGSCPRKEEECMYAHVPFNCSSVPPNNDYASDKRVMCCYDFIKGKCYRKDPPCKFFHPPPHLREVLLFNGRQNLILKSLRSQHAHNAAALFPSTPGLLPVIYAPGHLNNILTSKMSDGPQMQPVQQMVTNSLSSYWLIDHGGMAYFYPVIMGADNWVTIPANGIQGCQAIPSPPLHGSLKQVDHPSSGMIDDVISAPWLQNGFSLAQPLCGPLCYGSSTGFLKRPLPYDVNKVQ